MRLSELQALTPKLQVIAERYGASNIAVFGSVARDEATEASDVDLLVDLPPGTSLFEHAEFKQDLESLLEHNVDLIRRRNLKPGVRDRVEADAVPLALRRVIARRWKTSALSSTVRWVFLSQTSRP